MVVRGTSTSEPTSSFGSTPEVWFRNVEIDPGQVIQSFAKPVLDRVNAVLAPVKPVLEVLQKPLPLISQLAGRDYTLLDLAELYVPIYGGEISPETKRFIKAAKDLLSLIDTVNQISASGSISLGSYQLSGGGGAARPSHQRSVIDQSSAVGQRLWSECRSDTWQYQPHQSIERQQQSVH